MFFPLLIILSLSKCSPTVSMVGASQDTGTISLCQVKKWMASLSWYYSIKILNEMVSINKSQTMIIIQRTLCPVFPISIRGDKKLLISCCHALSTISVVQMNGIHIDYPPVQLTIGNWIEEECQPSGIGSTCSPPRIGNVQIKAEHST